MIRSAGGGQSLEVKDGQSQGISDRVLKMKDNQGLGGRNSQNLGYGGG